MMKTTTTPLIALLLIAASALPAAAQSYYWSPDVPTDLDGTTYLPWQIVRRDPGSHSLALTLPGPAGIDALHALNGQEWLVSFDAPVTFPGSGTKYEPFDLIRTDGTTDSAYFCGAQVGFPPGVNIDAALIDLSDGELVLSFDVVTDLSATGGPVVEPADLVRFEPGGPSCAAWFFNNMFFDASASGPGVPTSDNVTAAAEIDASVMVGLDVPSTLGATTYLPGEIAAWNGAAFSGYDVGAARPITSRIDALTGLTSPGSTPTTLTVDRSAITPGDLTLQWDPSCAAGAEDYGVYEGSLASSRSGVFDHTQIDCMDDGVALTEDVTPDAADSYYLVVPNNGSFEGAYGSGSAMFSVRPAGAMTCRPTQRTSCS